MRTVEERVADIEGQTRLYPQMFGALREDIAHLRGEMGRFRTETRAEMGQLRAEMGQGFARLDDRMSRQFTWMVGIQVTTLLTTLLTVVGALLARG